MAKHLLASTFLHVLANLYFCDKPITSLNLQLVTLLLFYPCFLSFGQAELSWCNRDKQQGPLGIPPDNSISTSLLLPKEA
jgi:hypothetical protein